MTDAVNFLKMIKQIENEKNDRKLFIRNQVFVAIVCTFRAFSNMGMSSNILPFFLIDPIIVYGNCMLVYRCLNYMLNKRIRPEQIIYVRPLDPSMEDVSIFNDTYVIFIDTLILSVCKYILIYCKG